MINSEQTRGDVLDSFHAIVTVGDIFINRREKQWSNAMFFIIHRGPIEGTIVKWWLISSETVGSDNASDQTACH